MSAMAPGEVTALLAKVGEGDDAARATLIELVYGELEVIARAVVRGGDASLDPHGLVHELYLRLAASPIAARDRKHFYAIASLAMRQIMVDRARRRRAAKRGGELDRVTLSGLDGGDRAHDLFIVVDALERLETLAPRQARIVELRCFVGLTALETAEVLGVSERTVHGEWRLARAWLVQALRVEPRVAAE
jgi:RNA polymerase sigma factor (TIGR02999 family)